jgi:hypothetical protein
MRPWMLLAGLLLTGCFDFDEPTEVKDLRVLGLSIATPEVFVMVDLNDSGEDEDAPLFTVTEDPTPVDVRVLVVDPRAPARELTFSVEACLQEDGGRCDDAPARERVRVVEGATGRAEELTFRFAPTAAQLNTWIEADPFQGYGGLFVMLDVTIRDADGETLRANKIVTYNVPFVPVREGQDPPPPKTPNLNPVLLGLRFDDQETMGEGETITLERGREYDVFPIFDRETQTETYPVATFPDESGQPGYRVLEEKLQFEFYATAGSIGRGTIETRNPTGEVEDDELKTTFEAPDDVPEVRLWVVFRDDRGGANWTTRNIRLR